MVCWTSQIALSKDANPMGSWSQVVGFLHTVDKFSISALLSANFCVKIFSLAHLHTLFRFYGVKKKIVYFPFLNLLLITLCNSLHLSYFYWSTTISWTHYLRFFFLILTFLLMLCWFTRNLTIVAASFIAFCYLWYLGVSISLSPFFRGHRL